MSLLSDKSKQSCQNLRQGTKYLQVYKQ